jgi:hypothetical protein
VSGPDDGTDCKADVENGIDYKIATNQILSTRNDSMNKVYDKAWEPVIGMDSLPGTLDYGRQLSRGLEGQ